MRKILISLLLLIPVQMLGQLGKNALPGGLQIFTVYESKSPSLTKILEYVANFELPDERYDIDFLDKVLTFERNIFKNFEVKIMRPNFDSDYDFVIAIANCSGFGKMNMSSKLIRSKYVINVNDAHFFFCLNHNKNDQICDEFIDEFLRPTNETYGCCRIYKPGLFDDISKRFDIFNYFDLVYGSQKWICERDENHEWQITYKSVPWFSEWTVFKQVAPSNVQLARSFMDFCYYLKKSARNYKEEKGRLIESGDSEYGIAPNKELLKRYFNDLPKECQESAKKETIINEQQ